MSPRDHKHRQDVLRVLKSAKPSLRKAILREADKGVIYSICELCDNTLVNNVPLTAAQKAKLKRHKHAIRHLSRRDVSWKKKKGFLVQRGGSFLPILLSVISSALGSLLGS